MEVQMWSSHLSNQEGLPAHFSLTSWPTRGMWTRAVVEEEKFSFSLNGLNNYALNEMFYHLSIISYLQQSFTSPSVNQLLTEASGDPWLRDGVVKDQSPINPSHSQSVTQLIGAGAASDRRETLADCWSMVHGIGSHLRRRT